MSTLTQPVRLAAVRPATPARRALLALAEVLARVALHRADPRASAELAAAFARRDRDAQRLLASTPPLR